MKATEYSDLPSEIIDMIFDELWNNTSNMPTWAGSTESFTQKRDLLRNCLPVSRDFRHRILSRFCRNNYLSLSLGDTYITRLKEVISPPWGSQLGGIGRYIKQFSLQLHIKKTDAPDVLRKSIHLLDCEDLEAILEGLHGEHFGVTQFSLDISADFQGSIAWADIPARFRSAFQALLRSPHLIRLNIQNLAFPSEAFFNGSHLKNLSIQQFSRIFAADSPGKEMDKAPLTLSGLPFPSLVELRTDHSHECDSDFLPASMLQKLKVFMEFQNERLHSKKTWRVLGLSASSLTDISISHAGAVVKPPETFNLGLVRNLKVFEYWRSSGSQNPFDSSNDQTPSILLHLFNVTEPMEYLISIKIDFDLNESFVDESFMQRTTTDSSWASLDRILTGSHFPCLRYFEISIKVVAMLRDRSDFDKRAFIDATKGRFKSSFSRMMVSETIIFTLQVWVSRSLLDDPSYSSDEYPDGTPYDEFDNGSGSEIEWDWGPSDDETEDYEEDYVGDFEEEF